MFSHLVNALSAYSDGNSDVSTKTRLKQLSSIWITLDNNMLLGTPLDVDLIIENAYGHYLYYYGIFGLLNLLLLIFFIIIKLYLNLKFIFKNTIDIRHRSIGISMFLSGFSLLIFSLAGSPLDANKSSYLFLLILGMYSAAIYNFRNDNNNGK
ncbi:hypothetical protein [Poseidonibacter antarcticus]|uniref:hypothetical protein n=1 Tax=Poseidonibacter antarcticus TaxID=2478538 RepID=UPI001D187619|nr:hypothetical protein [Poseidonibacter antarcticus]